MVSWKIFEIFVSFSPFSCHSSYRLIGCLSLRLRGSAAGSERDDILLLVVTFSFSSLSVKQNWKTNNINKQFSYYLTQKKRIIENYPKDFYLNLCIEFLFIILIP